MKELFRLKDDHIRVTAVTLQTVTDYTDDAVREAVRVPFRGKLAPLPGQIFLLERNDGGLSQAVLSYAADCEPSSLSIEDGAVLGDFGTADYEVLEAPAAGLQEAVLSHLLRYAPPRLTAMANTWGDRHGWSRVNDEFVRREMDACAELGLDALQIDDGWQTGSTADTTRRDSEGRRVFDDDFWEENKERFPQGLAAVAQYGREKGVRAGLWFAPDFHGRFAHAARDTKLLTGYAAHQGMDLIKLDMIHLPETEDADAFRDFLDTLTPYAELQLDVTNGQRLGYLGSLRYGTVFVENRYAAWKNYFPYRTFRNMWNLSRYIPAQTLLGEVLNADMNTDQYDESDPCAPVHYSEDYLFAACAVTNPLFWMETQFLSEARRAELSRIFPVWKAIRKELLTSPVIPVGEEPNGYAFSGYRCGRYLFCFRDNAKGKAFDFSLPNAGAELLAANGKVSLSKAGVFTAAKPRTYGLFRIKE